jgi:hypothetical protein
MADIAKTFALEGYKPRVTIVDGARTALMSDIGYRQRATNRVPLAERPPDRVPRIHRQLRRGRTGARARIAALTVSLPRAPAPVTSSA